MASYRPSTLDLSLGSVTLFTTLRNPNSISQNRQTELPFSQSSPTSPPSSPLAPLPQPRGMSGTSRPDGHAAASSDMDFWGIEDITDTQWAVDPADEEEDEQGNREAIELEQDGLRIQAVQQRNLDRARREDPRKTKLGEGCQAFHSDWLMRIVHS